MSKSGSAKDLKNEPLTKDDILLYAKEQSGFTFEMEILRMVTESCGPGKTKWGGLYCDPNTKKQREFDIETEKALTRDQRVELAIECKHLSENCPLVIFCTHRTEKETGMSRLKWIDHPRTPQYSHYALETGKSYEFYPTEKYVGRSLKQIGKDSQNGLKSIKGDSEIYDKWSQALSSLHNMIKDVLQHGTSGEMPQVLFLPIVVVPDKTLWQVKYTDNGVLDGEPEQVDSIDYWVGVSYRFQGMFEELNFQISHLHFLTKTGLQALIDKDDRLYKAFDTLFIK